MASSKVYTVKEVAKLLEFSTNTVYKYLNEGKIQAQRLGQEGRFRIPEAEVVRLLGLREKTLTPETPVQAPQVEQVTPEPQPEVGLTEIKNEALSGYSLPGLFDWFIATLGIFTVVAFLLFPEYLQSADVQAQLFYIQNIKIALALFGLLLIGVNLLKMHKGWVHKLIQLVLAGLFGALAFILFRTGGYVLAAGYFSVALVTLAAALLPIDDNVEFASFLAALSALLGFTFMNYPEAFPINSVTGWIKEHALLFGAFWYVGIWLTLIVGIHFSRLSKKFKKWLCFATAAALLTCSIFLVNASFWEQAVYFLIAGSFTMLLPYAKWFTSFDLDPDRNLLASFVWVVVVFAVGIGLVFYLQTSFKNFLVDEDRKRLAAASNLIENYIDESKSSLISFSSNSQLSNLVASPVYENGELDSLLRSLYLGSRNLRRISVFDRAGRGLGAYPLDEKIGALNIGREEYFTEVKNGSGMTISQGLQSTLAGGPVGVLITVPILDSEGQFAGALLGSVDLVKLDYLLNSEAQSDQRFFAVADQNRQIILHQDESQILKPVLDDRALILATNGLSGQFSDYTGKGILTLQSFRPIESLGWGLTVEQPFINISQQNSKLSFSIFLITIFVGIGSLLEVMSSRKRLEKI